MRRFEPVQGPVHHLSAAQGGTGTAGARRPGAGGRVAGAEPRLGEQHHTRSQTEHASSGRISPPPNTSESDVPHIAPGRPYSGFRSSLL